MKFGIENYLHKVESTPIRVHRELARQQSDIVPIENGVWECNFPTFRVMYGVKRVENDDEKARIPLLSPLVKMVSCRQVKIDMDTEIANIKAAAEKENKDIVFYKYRKWQPLTDFDSNFQKRTWIPMRYCLIDREYEENA